MLAACSARAAGYEWSPPANRAVQVHPDGAEGWKVTSTEAREFTLESEQRLAAQPGDAFEINLRLRADLNTRGTAMAFVSQVEGAVLLTKTHGHAEPVEAAALVMLKLLEGR